MKKLLPIGVVIIVLIIVLYQFRPVRQLASAVFAPIKHTRLINTDSNSIYTRVDAPKGYQRVRYPKGSFQEYLRRYKLKSFGSKIINYDDSEYFWQHGHIGILDMSVPKNGLQQCADALIRMRSEYLWEQGRTSKIGFKFTSGHYCSWSKYAAGYRPKISGNKVTFHKTAKANHTKANFYKYLNLIYTYSGTLSLYHELPKVNAIEHLKIGDMLIKGGTPGHVVILCDEVINESGEKLFLLCQGNTPAQSVHLVKNLEDAGISPWYALQKDTIISVSNYTFYDSKFVRFK